MTPQKLGPYQAGDEVVVEIDVVDALGAVADLTNITPVFTLSRPEEQSAIVTSEGLAPTATADVESSGIVLVTIEAAVTQHLLSTYEWRCSLKDLQGNTQLIARGYVDFIARIQS